MSRDDHALIAEIVNARRPGLARFVGLPRLDHHFSAYDGARQAFAEEGGQVDLRPLDLVLEWIKQVLADRTADVPAAPRAPAAHFTSDVQPLLARRCTPCHVPGGKMYSRLPFDDAEVVRTQREGVLRRLEGDERRTVEAWLEAPAD
jgi:hypothetical protein